MKAYKAEPGAGFEVQLEHDHNGVEITNTNPLNATTRTRAIKITHTRTLPKDSTRLFNRIETDNSLPTIPTSDVNRGIDEDIKEEETIQELYDADGNMTIHTLIDQKTSHEDDQISFGDTTVLQQPVPDSLPESQSKTVMELGCIIGNKRRSTTSKSHGHLHVITPTPTAPATATGTETRMETHRNRTGHGWYEIQRNFK